MNTVNNFLIFDTEALLSANKRNPLQVWNNNQQLGQCYIPALVFQEIEALSKCKNSKDNHKAQDFIRFFNKKGCRYKIAPKEIRRNIVDQAPLNDEKDRQLFITSLSLAKNPNNSCICIVLITYNKVITGLIKQSGLINICTLKPDELAKWLHTDSLEGRVPKPVYDTHNRLNRSRNNRFLNQQSSSFKNQKNIQNKSLQSSTNSSSSKSNYQKNNSGRRPKTIHQIPETSNSQPRKHLPSSSQRTNQKQTRPNSHNTNIIIAVSTFATIALMIGAFIYIDNQRNKEEKTPISATPAGILASADNSISEFRRSRSSDSLLTSIKQLERLKSEQGNKLDSEGEQKLSGLKHKYAIEVLASSSKNQAAEYLRQIPNTYHNYENVEKWLEANGY
jgi:hypothetical protein